MSITAIASVIPGIVDLIDRFIPDPAEAQKAKREIVTRIQNQEQQLRLETIRTNQLEAEHGGAYRGGWRPLIGWACALAFAWNYVAQPVLSWVVTAFGFGLEVPPMIAADYLTEMTLTLLGWGGLRGVEKYKSRRLVQETEMKQIDESRRAVDGLFLGGVS